MFRLILDRLERLFELLEAILRELRTRKPPPLRPGSFTVTEVTEVSSHG
jgi:hypothetical protein